MADYSIALRVDLGHPLGLRLGPLGGRRPRRAPEGRPDAGRPGGLQRRGLRQDGHLDHRHARAAEVGGGRQRQPGGRVAGDGPHSLRRISRSTVGASGVTRDDGGAATAQEDFPGLSGCETAFSRGLGTHETHRRPMISFHFPWHLVFRSLELKVNDFQMVAGSGVTGTLLLEDRRELSRPCEFKSERFKAWDLHGFTWMSWM